MGIPGGIWRFLFGNLSKRKGKAVASLVLVAAWCMALFLAPSIFYINVSPSLPMGVYVRIPATVIRRGDVVCYSLPGNAVQEIVRLSGEKPDITLFMKKVGALGGDDYEIVPGSREFLANGELIGVARRTSGRGKPMPDLSGRHTVPPGEFLPVAPNPASFDGRYTGTVPLSNIVSRAVPFVVFQ